MKTNTAKARKAPRTHEGGRAKTITAEAQLRRSVMACLLWEDTFYEDGVHIAQRIAETVPRVEANAVFALAVEARSQMNLRHVPLLLAREMARNPHQRHVVAETLANVIQRADELSEFLAIYWKDGRCKLAAGVKKGLARAFPKFSAYQLGKYNSREASIKLRDVLFLCHAKPKSLEQAQVWKALADGTLAAPDTWEVALSGGADKKETFTRLMAEGKLGALALLRNLRNMEQAGVEREAIRQALAAADVSRVLPFRFIAAARYAPSLEPDLEAAMFRSLGDDVTARLPGRTVLFVDVSGSMEHALSLKSDMRRVDAACGLAMVLRELCDDIAVFTFSNKTILVPARRGFALRDVIVNSQEHGGTYLAEAITSTKSVAGQYDRIVVITDEQAHDGIADPRRQAKAYVINVASYKNGVGYGRWTHLDGFSEAVLRWMSAYERRGLVQAEPREE